MAGRNHVGVDVSLGRSSFAVRISDRLRQRHSSLAVLAGSGAIEECKGRLYIGAVPGFAGICIVHTATANVWLPVSDSYAAGDGEIPSGSFLAIVDAAADFSGVGEHAWLVHHWNRRSRFVFMRGIIFFPTGQRASHRVDAQTAAATGGGVAVLSGGLADHAIRNATRRVSVRYGVFTADQRCQRK